MRYLDAHLRENGTGRRSSHGFTWAGLVRGEGCIYEGHRPACRKPAYLLPIVRLDIDPSRSRSNSRFVSSFPLQHAL